MLYKVLGCSSNSSVVGLHNYDYVARTVAGQALLGAQLVPRLTRSYFSSIEPPPLFSASVYHVKTDRTHDGTDTMTPSSSRRPGAPFIRRRKRARKIRFLFSFGT